MTSEKRKSSVTIDNDDDGAQAVTMRVSEPVGSVGESGRERGLCTAVMRNLLMEIQLH